MKADLIENILLVVLSLCAVTMGILVVIRFMLPVFDGGLLYQTYAVAAFIALLCYLGKLILVVFFE